jgi:hypothetical protein
MSAIVTDQHLRMSFDNVTEPLELFAQRQFSEDCIVNMLGFNLRQGRGFRSAGSAQRFVSFHAAVYNTFNVQRHLISARTHRAFRALAMNTWRSVTAAA